MNAIKARAKLKETPFPEFTHHSLHRAHPLRAIDNDHSFSAGKNSLAFADIEVATLDRSNDPSISQDTPTPKAVQVGVVKSNLSRYPDNDCKSDEDGYEEATEEVSSHRSDNLKPTDMVALERKLTPRVNCRRSTCTSGGCEQHNFMGKKDDRVREVSRRRRYLGSRAAMWKDVTPKGNSVVGASAKDFQKSGSEQPSAQAKGMWDNMVSWMKMAVDFIGKEGTAKEDPSSPGPRGKKRSLETPDSLTRKRFRILNSDKANDGLSQILEFEPVEEASFNSSSQLAGVSPVKSTSVPSPPLKLSSSQSGASSSVSSGLELKNSRKKRIKWKSSHIQQNSTSDHDGLNSILDAPLGQIPSFGFRSKIKCRTFQGNDVNSPDLTNMPVSAIMLRKSPRLHAASSSIPVPPPPPLIPVAPPLPPPPSSLTSHSIATPLALPPPIPSGSVDHSRDILNQLQSRLRRRIRSKAAGGDDGGSVEGGGGSHHIDGRSLDAKSIQWAEIQAHSRRIPMAEFLSLAEENKKELKAALASLDVCLPSTLQGIAEVVELLQAGSLWFPGGNKEMRESLPLYRKLEKKLEILTEYVQVCGEMEVATCFSKCARKKEPSGHADLYASLKHIREEFDVKHRHWGAIISSHAQSWTKVGLPVCHRLLAKSCDHLCGLVCCYVTLCLDEASRLHGILLSIKCTRTVQMKEKLRECLTFLLDAHSYFVQDYSTCSSQSGRDSRMTDSSSPSSSASHDVCYDRTRLLSMIVDVVAVHGNISLLQFDGYVLHFGRQGMCGHFEEILKMVSLVKSIVTAVFSTKVTVRNWSGILLLLPDSMELGTVLHRCCEKLVQHIVGRARSLGVSGHSPSSKEKLFKELILWMMFGCKYMHQCLEFFGTEQAQQLGLCSLLLELQHTEDLL